MQTCARALALLLALAATDAAAAVFEVSSTDAGWYRDDGRHDDFNDNYVVGRIPFTATPYDGVHRNFMVFDVPAMEIPIVSATLTIECPTLGYFSDDASESFVLRDVLSAVSALVAPHQSDAAGRGIFTDLGSGTIYGSATVSEDSEGSMITIPLNAAAVAALNAQRGGTIAFGGSLDTLDPNPTRHETFFSFSSSSYVTELTITALSPWENPIEPLDVNNDGFISAIDAVIIINRLNAGQSGKLPPPFDGQPPPFLDTSGDGFMTSLDVALLFNYLNAQSNLSATPVPEPSTLGLAVVAVALVSLRRSRFRATSAAV